MSIQEAVEEGEEGLEKELADRLNSLTMQPECPFFPCDLQVWNDLKHLLEDLKNVCLNEKSNLEDVVFSVEDIYTAVQAGYRTNDFDIVTSKKERKPKVKTKDPFLIDYSFVWYGLFEFLQCNCPEEERRLFLHSTLPRIIDLILDIDDFIPSDFCYSRQQRGGNTVLSRNFVARILACSFLCLFPERIRGHSSCLNIINFTKFFSYMHVPAQIAKFRMIVSYFEKITEKECDLSGNIVYCRQVIEEKMLPTVNDLLNSSIQLCSIFVHHEGTIEDIGCDGIQVDFANRFIGGGVLGRGRVQEEIRFCECPELIASLLFMETMEDNEAIVIYGFEQFSWHLGYASSLEYGGNFQDPSERDEENNLKNTLCAIDAINYKDMGSMYQYKLSNVLREFNKALVGFCHPCEQTTRTERQSVSTDEEYQSAAASFDEESPVNTEPENEQKQLSEIAVSLVTDILSNVVKKPPWQEQTNQSEELLKKLASIDQSPNPLEISLVHTEQPNVCVCETGSESSAQSSKKLHDCNRSLTNICDKKHAISPVIVHPQNGSSDLLDINCSHKISCIRRRSSNLSDVSRRSSSSTKHSSSDLSSDLEEFYESYLKSEKKKHGTILEDGFQPAIDDFAASIVAHLMQEGTCVAAQMVPKLQIFDIVPPKSVFKPYACRPSAHKRGYDGRLKASSAVESFANRLVKSVMNSALTEAAVIIKYVSASMDTGVSASQSSFPGDECFHLFADQIVQDVFMGISNDYAAGILGNLTADILQYEFGASYSPRESPANFPVSASSASSLTSVRDKEMPDNKRLSESDRIPLNIAAGESSGFVPVSSLKKRLSDSEIKLSSVTAGESSGFVPVSTASQHFDQETTLLNKNQSSSIPKNSDELADVIQNVRIPVNYQEAAAIIVDQVFQSIPYHMDHGSQSKLSVSIKSSLKGDSLSSVSDAHDSQLGNEHQKETKETKPAIILPCFGVPTKHLSREMLTSAFLNVEGRRQIKTYERRSSEPCHISVGLSLKAYNVPKPYSKDDKKLKLLRNDDDFPNFHNNESMRRGSWSSFPTDRRKSLAGFKDPVLSKFAEELMKADTSIPPLLIMQAHTGTSTTDSRRSSLSGFRDTTLANLEGELLNSSFCLTSSPRQSIRSRSCGHNQDQHLRSDSTCSEAEYWFPLPKRVGHEFQEEFERLGHYHSVDEIEDFANTFANNIIQQAVSIIYHDAGLDFATCCLNHPSLLSYADALAQDITSSAFLTIQGMSEAEKQRIRRLSRQRGRRASANGSDDECQFVDTLDVPLYRVQLLAEDMADQILKVVFSNFDKNSHSKKHFCCRGKTISTGNWGSGAFGGDPQLKCVLQWMAASEVQAPSIHYYTFGDNRLEQIDEVLAMIQSLNWTVGDLMKTVEKYCSMEWEKFNLSYSCFREQTPNFTLFEFILLDLYK